MDHLSTMQSSRAVDVGRLRRAVSRRVKRIGPDRFLVEGRTEPEYLVDLNAAPACTCVDAQRHGGLCLHELTARLHAGDGALITMLGEILAATDRALRTTRVRLRRSVEARHHDEAR